MRQEKRSCGRCGYWIDLNPKTPRRIGTGEVQSELHGLGTTHASYVIRYLTNFIDFGAHAAGETFVRPMWVLDQPNSKPSFGIWYGGGPERVSRAEDYACELHNSEFDE